MAATAAFGDLLTGVPRGGLMSDENLFGSLFGSNLTSTLFDFDRASSHASASSSDDLRSCSPAPNPVDGSLTVNTATFSEAMQPHSIFSTTNTLTSKKQQLQQGVFPQPQPLQQQRWQPQPHQEQVKTNVAMPKLPLKKASSNSSGDSGLSPHDSEVLARSKITNRRAQKRYREKQKEKACGLENQVAAMEAQLREMELAKSTLEARNNLLEKFVDMRGGMHGTGVVGSQPESWWLDSEAKRRIEAQMGLHGTLTFTVRGEDAPLLMGREEVGNISFPDFCGLWREYVNEFARLLAEANNDFRSPLIPRLGQMCGEYGQLRCAIAISHPTRLFAYMSRRANDDELTEIWAPPSNETNRQLLDHLKLTPEQQQHMLTLRRAYLHNLAVVVKRRQQASAALQAAITMGSSNCETGADWLRAAEAIDKLKQTLCDEHCFMLQFHVTTFKKVLNVFQSASVNVQAYPWSPDLLALANIVAEDLGAPPAAELMRSAADKLEPNLSLLIQAPSQCKLVDVLRNALNPPTTASDVEEQDDAAKPAVEVWDCNIHWNGTVWVNSKGETVQGATSLGSAALCDIVNSCSVQP